MDWNLYKTSALPSAWTKVVHEKLPSPKCEKIGGFCFVKSSEKFDLTSYTKELPVVVVLNCNTVIGWSENTSASSYLELQPWATNKPVAFYYSPTSIRQEETLLNYIKLIRGRLEMLAEMNADMVPEKIWFEKSRHALLSTVLTTKCVDVSVLVEKEVEWMKRCITTNVVMKCCDTYKLPCCSKETLEEHIRLLYNSIEFEIPIVVPPAFTIVSQEIAKSLA